MVPVNFYSYAKAIPKPATFRLRERPQIGEFFSLSCQITTLKYLKEKAPNSPFLLSSDEARNAVREAPPFASVMIDARGFLA